MSFSPKQQMSGDAVLLAKIKDAVALSQQRGYAHFVGFLDERAAAVSRQYMESTYFKNYMLWGGFAEAERVVFGAFPDFLEPSPEAFPISAVTASFRQCDSLSHRDFLGAFLGAGLKRKSIGDILVEQGRAIVFCREELKPFLLSQIVKVGRVGVKLSEGAKKPLPHAHTYQELNGVVASARLDCLTAAMVGMSREKAATMIAEGGVEVNHFVQISSSKELQEGDLLSIHGKGRYQITRLGPVTKKGRLSFAGKKYV
ncbi:MAG: YlmH/Sll1252 family protein [Oscillospiraceae bacterium]|jgi:RNA-binding protein YlmH|nr:S4 RNA-binding domain-containing protein [Ruminococcaceae bacterium BL-4]